MDLSPSLRVHLDAIAPYLEDKTVTEVIVAGPGRVLVSRGGAAFPVELELPETRIRALSERLARALGPGKSERAELCTGRLGELLVTLVGASRGPRCPLIRVTRPSGRLDSLEALEARGELDPSTRASLEAAVAKRRGIVVLGPRVARTLDYLSALVRAWPSGQRVAILGDGPIDRAPLVLEADAVAAAAALGADVIVAAEPSPAVLSELLLLGRPFLVSLEIADQDAALTRVLALALAGHPTWSRAAAEALLESVVGHLLVLGPSGEVPRGWWSLVHQDGALKLRSEAGSLRPGSSRPPSLPRPNPSEVRPAPPASGRPSVSSSRPRPEPTASRRPSSRPPSHRPSSAEVAASALERPGSNPALSSALASGAATPEDISEILPQNLLSTSFVGRMGSGNGADRDRAGETLPIPPEHEPEDGAVTPDLVEGDADFNEEETAGTKELLRNEPQERLPTLAVPPPSRGRGRVGLGSDVWASREYKRLGPSEGTPDLAELHTSTGQLPPALDPFEGDPVEATFHADGHEMVPTGSYSPELIEPNPDDVRDSRVDPPDGPGTDTGSWADDEEEGTMPPPERKEPRRRLR